MFDLPPSLERRPAPRAPRRGRWLGLALVAAVAALLALPAGCRYEQSGWQTRRDARFYPPAPQAPCVVALGTLRGQPAPTPSEVQLSMLLFGTEPPGPLAVVNPTDVACRDDLLLICDAMLATVLQWRLGPQGGLVLTSFDPPLEQPRQVAFDPDGNMLICQQSSVVRIDPAGREIGTYVRPDEPFRPADALVVDDQLWVSNTLGHTIDVFDLDSGQYRRSIGGRGSGPGRFMMPRGLALTPKGEVCVVDMLNRRVQVLDRSGRHLRDIGQPGDTPGCLGRPRDVAVGPDGAIFVTDAFAQRVHVFDRDGAVLLSFGEPGSGLGELTLPNGIAVTRVLPQADLDVPADLDAQYYVLVAEQLDQAGVRVYAWLGTTAQEVRPPEPATPVVRWVPPDPQRVAENPHWKPDRCEVCPEDGRLEPIPFPQAEAQCLECHDGIGAPADPHPIGRPASRAGTVVPEGWPTHEDRIGCLTCHDVQAQCRRNVERPVGLGVLMLRNYDPQRRLEYCATCHQSDVGQRFSPHRQRDAQGRIREDACLFCHTRRPEIPADGRRRFEPALRNESSRLCLNCHTRHWDLSPQGHVDRPVTPAIRRWMLMWDLSREYDLPPAELRKLAGDTSRRPRQLPLGEKDNREVVTCYSCHNPHYEGLFPAGSELAARARNPQDREAALRADWVNLCSHCHQR